MMLFNLVFSIFLAVSDLYCWKKTNDRKFLLISLVGAIVVLANVITYVYSDFFFVSSVLTILLLALVSWYDWKKFGSEVYFWGALLSLVLVVVKTYDLYFDQHYEQFSVQYRIASLAFVSIVLAGIVATIITIYARSRKR